MAPRRGELRLSREPSRSAHARGKRAEARALFRRTGAHSSVCCARSGRGAGELALDLDGLSADRAALEEQYRDVSGQSLAAVIAERTAHILRTKHTPSALRSRQRSRCARRTARSFPTARCSSARKTRSSPCSSRRSWGSRRRSRNGGRRDEGCAGGEVARGIEKIPSRRARGAPRHRADAAAGRKCEGRANSRQSGRRGVRPRRGAGGDGEHPARHRRRGRAAADAHRGLRHEARAGAGYDRRAQRERGHEAQERDGRRRYGQRHAGRSW